MLRSVLVAYLLWFPWFGVIGLHRLYCGRVGTAVLWALTGGLLGIGWLVDLFLIPGMVEEANRPVRYAPSGGVGAADAAPVREAPAAARIPAARVLYCTQCGRPMRVAADAGGRACACPACRTILTVPA